MNILTTNIRTKIKELIQEIKAYHGSYTGHKAFDVKHTGHNSHTFGEYDNTRHGTFFSLNPEFAALYGDDMEYELLINNTVDLDNYHDFPYDLAEFLGENDEYDLAHEVKNMMYEPIWHFF